MNKFLLTGLSVALISSAMADDFDDAFSDDVFSDDPFADIETDIPEKGSSLSINHQLSLQAITNINSDRNNATQELYSGVTSLTAQYRPKLSYQPVETFSISADVAIQTDGIFWLREDDAWSDEDIDARQYDYTIYELIGQSRINGWQINSGIQNVTLGLADALSVSNVLYAQDLSVPGTTDLDDTIKPAWTSVVSGSIGPVRIKAGSVHTHEVNDTPVLGTDFDVADATSGLTLNQMLALSDLSIEANDLSLANMAWFASMSGVVGPLDWQLNAVSQLAHSPTIELGIVGMTPAPVALHYPRVTTLSVAGSYVTGPILWKLEGAWNDGQKAQTANGMMPGEMMAYQRASATLGLDYDHGTLGRFVAEFQYGTILDYDSYGFMNTDESSAQWALMYSKSFLRETLTVTGQVIGFDVDASGGRIQAIGAQYDFSDAVSAEIRLVDYVEGDFQFLQGADDRDRVLTSLTYRF